MINQTLAEKVAKYQESYNCTTILYTKMKCLPKKILTKRKQAFAVLCTG